MLKRVRDWSMSGFVCFPGSRSLWYCMAPISAPLHFWTRRIAYCLPIGGGTSRLLEQKGNALPFCKQKSRALRGPRGGVSAICDCCASVGWRHPSSLPSVPGRPGMREPRPLPSYACSGGTGVLSDLSFATRFPTWAYSTPSPYRSRFSSRQSVALRLRTLAKYPRQNTVFM